MVKRTPTALEERALKVHERLSQAILEPKVELSFRNPWELLIAAMIAAQTSDSRVNQVTYELFRAYPTPQSLAESALDDVERIIQPTGLFRTKAKAIRSASRAIVERFQGLVPRHLDQLIDLPGVARKTANVVLGGAFGLSTGIVVDTHVRRVARRLGLTSEQNPIKVESDLCALFEPKQWIATGHRFVLHGRYLCKTRQPSCRKCPLNELCPSAESPPEGTWRARAKAESVALPTKIAVIPKARRKKIS